jgi:hypothetical protein
MNRLRKLSDEYDRVKWGVVGKIMGIEWEECERQAREMDLI